MKRSSGILLPIFSLPSEYGIGSLGAEARAFAHFLQDAAQSWWQILPVGPAGAGDSPYASESTFAGNPLFIDLDLLARDGLLTEEERGRYMNGLSTIGKNMSRDFRDLSPDAFLKKYGHLRPGTYDICSPRYDQDGGRYFDFAQSAGTATSRREAAGPV